MSAFISLLNERLSSLDDERLTADMKRAIFSISRCRTGALGESKWQCQGCHYDDRSPLSCGHRNCPQCQHSTTVQWLERQESKLLPCSYFMLTFTLPAQLRQLAVTHPKRLFSLMFSVAASVLKGFAEHKHAGESGFTLVLHTHNRRRDLHPHLHALS